MATNRLLQDLPARHAATIKANITLSLAKENGFFHRVLREAVYRTPHPRMKFKRLAGPSWNICVDCE